MAIGNYAKSTHQYSITIAATQGGSATVESAGTRSIVLSTNSNTGFPSPNIADAFFVDPIRYKATSGTNGLYYDPTTKGVFHAPEATRRRLQEAEDYHEVDARIAALEAEVAAQKAEAAAQNAEIAELKRLLTEQLGAK